MFFKWIKKYKEKEDYEDENIFRSISKKTDSECKFLTKLNFQKCYYEKSNKKNIIKRCFDFEVLQWESVVYLYLVDKRIAPLMTFELNSLCYETHNKISLYEYIIDQSKNSNIKFLLNELFGFVSKFRNYNFLHGNLHVHNVFINPNTFTRKGHFYVIDYSNSFLLDKSNKSPMYQRSSFIGEIDKKITSIFFEYWDFFTLYISLKLLLKSNLDNVAYLDGLIKTYVNNQILDRFIHEYKSYNDSNIVTYHLNNNPTFIDT